MAKPPESFKEFSMVNGVDHFSAEVRRGATFASCSRLCRVNSRRFHSPKFSLISGISTGIIRWMLSLAPIFMYLYGNIKGNPTDTHVVKIEH